MAHANATARLEPLSRENYETWKVQAEALLIKNDAWGYVSGETEQPKVTGEGAALAAAQAAAKTWLVADRKAKADLILAINPSELSHIRDCATSRAVWLKLESVYASKGPARKATLLKQLMQHRMQDGEDIKTHISSFFDAADKLLRIDFAISDELLSIMLLFSLPPSFDNFRCAIEARDELLDVETLKVKILDEYNARKQNRTEDGNSAMFVKPARSRKQNTAGEADKQIASGSAGNQNKHKPKPKFKCGFCDKKSHKESECFLKKKLANQSNKSNEAHHVFFVDRDSDKSTRLWCIDSGCTSHLCRDKDAFVDRRRTVSGLKLADSSATRVEGQGDVKIALADSPDNVVTLKNTLYVPEVRTNLISVAKIVDHGNTVTFERNRAVVHDGDGNVRVVAERQGDLFLLRELERDREQQANAVEDPKATWSDVATWHARLGHLNYRVLAQMIQRGNVTGLEISREFDAPSCDSCATAKMTRLPFAERESRSTELLEIIHTDICGPMRTTLQGGARYFLTFIDDFSRWGHVYFLRHKGEVAEKFIEFKNQTGRRIKAVQSDNGKEFCNGKMETILKDAGVQHRLNVPHTPQQNGEIALWL